MRRSLQSVIATSLLAALSALPLHGQNPPPTPAQASLPAFHGGGPLLGVAPAIPAPPYAVRWTFKTDEDRAAVEGSPTIAGNVVYVADANGSLHAVNLADGKVKWTYKIEEGFATSPLVHNGRVYLGDLAGVFHCVGAEDGKKVWTVDTGTGIHSSANADGNKIVFGNDGAEIFCLNAEDGKELWRGKAGDRVNAAPSIANGLAYVSGCDAMLRAIDLNTGEEKFAVDIGGMAGGSAVVVPDKAGGRLVVGTDGGKVLCLSADGKTTHWTYNQVEGQAMVYATPAVSVQHNLVVVGARDRNVHAIDLATGQRKWALKTRGDVDASALIAGDLAFVGSKDKKLYALDLKTGKAVWNFTAGRSVDAGPDINAGVVVFADSAGNVYCLEPQKK